MCFTIYLIIMAEHNDFGKFGEEIAIEHIKNSGYDILNTNWRFGADEVDIIAKDIDFLVFIEVKTRNSNYFGEPEVFVNRKKQQFLFRAANNYVQKYNIREEIRFDIISIVVNSKQKKINHIKDAFSICG